jgi:TorA maturation chaperone TorD
VLSQKFNTLAIEDRLAIYQLISSYYLEGTASVSLENLSRISFLEQSDNELLRASYNKVCDGLEADNEQANYEYNRLFIGPDKVIAAPYESVYRNSQRLMMQQETLRVRQFYSKLGLGCAAVGNQPDDHLGLELECMSYLLYQMLQENELRDEFIDYYREFLENHVLVWAFNHCEDVLNNSKTQLNSGMAMLLKGMLEIEKQEAS